MCSVKTPKIPKAPEPPEPELPPLQAVYTDPGRRSFGPERLKQVQRGGFVGGAGISTPPVVMKPSGSGYQKNLLGGA